MKHQHAIAWSLLDKQLPGWRGVLPAWEAKGVVSRPLKKPGTGRVIFPKGFVLPDQLPAKSIAPARSVPPPPPEYGLGKLIRQGIDLTTFGMGKALAYFVATKFLRKANCGCAARQACLDKLVPDVRDLSATDWIMKAPAIWKCARTADDPETIPA
jgi:hypothetical protein